MRACMNFKIMHLARCFSCLFMLEFGRNQGGGSMFHPQMFGDRLRNLRLLSGKTARELSSEIGVTATYLWLLEKGWTNPGRKPPQPSIDVVAALIMALDVTEENAKLLLEYAGYDKNLSVKKLQKKLSDDVPETIPTSPAVEIIDSDQFLKYKQELIGADEYIKQICDFLDQAAQPALFTARMYQFLVVTGLGGSGKTAITATALNKYIDKYIDTHAQEKNLPEIKSLNYNNLTEAELKNIIYGWMIHQNGSQYEGNNLGQVTITQALFQNVIVVIDNLPPDKYSNIIDLFDHTNAIVILIMNGLPELITRIIPTIINIDGLSDEDGATYLRKKIHTQLRNATEISPDNDIAARSMGEINNTIYNEYYKKISCLVKGHPISLNLIGNLINSRPKENISRVFSELQGDLQKNNFIETVYNQPYDRCMALEGVLDYTIQNSELKQYFDDPLFCIYAKLLTNLQTPNIRKSTLKNIFNKLSVAEKLPKSAADDSSISLVSLDKTLSADSFIAVLLQYGILHIDIDTEMPTKNSLNKEAQSVLFLHPIMRNAISHYLYKTDITKKDMWLFYDSLVASFVDDLKNFANSDKCFASLQEKLEYLCFEYSHIEQALDYLLKDKQNLDDSDKLDSILTACAYLCDYWEHHRNPTESPYEPIIKLIRDFVKEQYDAPSKFLNLGLQEQLAYIRVKLFLTDQTRRSFRDDITVIEKKYTVIQSLIKQIAGLDCSEYLNAHVELRLGKLHRYEEQFDTAIHLFDSAIAIFKKYTDEKKQAILFFEFTNEYLITCYYFKGWLLEEFGRIPEALEQYKNGIITARGSERFSAAACYLRIGYLNLLSGNMKNGAYYLHVCKTLDKDYAYGSAIVDIYQGFAYVLSRKLAQGSLLIFRSFLNLRANFADGRSYLLSGYYLAIAVLHSNNMEVAQKIRDIISSDVFPNDANIAASVHAPQNLTKIILNHIDATILQVQFLGAITVLDDITHVSDSEQYTNIRKYVLEMERFLVICFYGSEQEIDSSSLMEEITKFLNSQEVNSTHSKNKSFINFKLYLIFYYVFDLIVLEPQSDKKEQYQVILQKIINILSQLQDRFDYEQLIHMLNMENKNGVKIFPTDVDLYNPFNQNLSISKDTPPYQLFKSGLAYGDITDKLHIDIDLLVKQLLSIQDIRDSDCKFWDVLRNILAHLLASVAEETIKDKACDSTRSPEENFVEDPLFLTLKSAFVGNIEYHVRFTVAKAFIILYPKIESLIKQEKDPVSQYRDNQEDVAYDIDFIKKYQEIVARILEFCKKDDSSEVLMAYYKYIMEIKNFDGEDLTKLKDIWLRQDNDIRRRFVAAFSRNMNTGSFWENNSLKIREEIPEMDFFSDPA